MSALLKIDRDKLRPRKKSGFAVVGIRLDQEVTYALQVCSEREASLNLGLFKENLNLETLLTYLEKDTPLVLHFYGANVLSKHIKKSAQIETALFNNKVADFYISQNNFREHNYVSIVRRDQIAAQLTLFMERKYTLLDMSIGPFTGLILKDLLGLERFQNGDYLLDLSNNTLDYRTMPSGNTSYQLGAEEVQVNQLPLIAAYLNFKSDFSFIEGKEELFAVQRKEYKMHNYFLKGLLGVVVTTLIALVISSLLQETLKSKYLEAEAQLFFLEKSYNEISKLKDEKERLAQVLQSLGGFSEQYYTHYVYEALQSIPETIRLDHMEVNPTIGKATPSKEIALMLNTIRIYGKTDQAAHVTNWITRLNTSVHFKKTEVLELYEDRDNRYVFVININY